MMKAFCLSDRCDSRIGTRHAFPTSDDLNTPTHPSSQGARKPKKPAMYHTIEFMTDSTINVEVSPKHWLERVLVRKGTRRHAQIKPYVIETQYGPTEVADLYFDDGTTTRMLRFEYFAFVD